MGDGHELFLLYPNFDISRLAIYLKELMEIQYIFNKSDFIISGLRKNE
jgi:hypothetical protein